MWGKFHTFFLEVNTQLWDTPYFLQGPPEILFCDMYGNVCFENSMQNNMADEDCDCPMECDSVSYSFTMISTPFHIDKMCPGEKTKTDFLMKEFYENKFPAQFV